MIFSRLLPVLAITHSLITLVSAQNHGTSLRVQSEYDTKHTTGKLSERKHEENLNLDNHLQNRDIEHKDKMRSLDDWNLEDLMLVTTADGSLQGRDRSSGAVAWTLFERPMIEIEQIKGIKTLEPIWIAEPTEGGALLHFDLQNGLGRIPLSIQALIDKAPYALPGTIVYLGSKRSLMYAIDAATGQLQKVYGLPLDSDDRVKTEKVVDEATEFESFEQQKFPRTDVHDRLDDRETRPTTSGLLLIGRVEYTLEIHDEASSCAWRLKYSTWQPNVRDTDLQSQYYGPRDDTYILTTKNDTIIAVSEKNVFKPLWTGSTESTVIDTYDIMSATLPHEERSEVFNDYGMSRALAIFLQPTKKVTSKFYNNVDDIYVGSIGSGGYFALSGPKFSILLSSSPSAQWCLSYPRNYIDTDDLNNLLGGLHPSWCQSLLRQLDPPKPEVDVELPDPNVDAGIIRRIPTIIFGGGSAWLSLTYRIFENLIAIVIIGLAYWFASRRGWIGFTKQHSTAPVMTENINVGISSVDAAEPTTVIEAPKEVPPIEPQEEVLQGQMLEVVQEEPQEKSALDEPDEKKEIVAIKTELEGMEKELELTQQDNRHLQSAPISVSDEVLGLGSHGTIVFKGQFQKREVAVKRMLHAFYDVASQEIDILQESDDHPNVIRYYCKNTTDEFLFVALELCQCTLEDIIYGRSSGMKSHEKDEGIRQLQSRFDVKDSLRQVCLGLQHLHFLKIVHRDLKPQNILIAEPRPRQKKELRGNPRVLISDFGLCKKLEGEQSSFQATASSIAGTSGWAAPEIAVPYGRSTEGSSSSYESVFEDKTREEVDPRPRLTRAVDIFSLGCIFYYALSQGKHPFGESYERQSNIQKNQYSLAGLDGIEDKDIAIDLIEQMISSNSSSRPTVSDVMNHPFFWTSQAKLDFLVRVSDRFEHATREEVRPPLLSALEECAPTVLGDDWHTRFPPEYIQNLGKFRKYHGDRVIDLLRAFRNKLHHYNDYSPEMKALVGDVPEGYLRFYTSRFPLLFISIYKFVRANISEESAFAPFFDKSLGS